MHRLQPARWLTACLFFLAATARAAPDRRAADSTLRMSAFGRGVFDSHQTVLTEYRRDKAGPPSGVTRTVELPRSKRRSLGVAVQDDDREAFIRQLFGLIKPEGSGRSGTDAVLLLPDKRPVEFEPEIRHARRRYDRQGFRARPHPQMARQTLADRLF